MQKHKVWIAGRTPPVRGRAGLPITGPGCTRSLELKSPGACTCGPAVNWDVAQDDRVLGVAPLGQLVAAGVGAGISVIDPSAVLATTTSA